LFMVFILWCEVQKIYIAAIAKYAA